MCNEAKGLSASARKMARWVVMAFVAALALAALRAGSMNEARGEDAPALPPNPSADEPVAPKLSLAKSAEMLDAVALDWTRKRQCGTCHTNYAYMISRPALKGHDESALKEIRGFFENRVAHWDDAEKAARPRWDAEVIATAVTLAINDSTTTGKLHPATRKALDRIWTLQKPDGSWSWLKCDWPPYEHDDYYGAVFAAVGVGAAPDGYAQSDAARLGLDRLKGFLKSTPAPDLHHKTFLLWASTRIDGLMSDADRTATIAAMRSLQRPDGGWSLPSFGDWKRRDGSPNAKDAPSDGYATGLAVFVLRQAGIPASDPAIARGKKWLETNQRTSGRWYTRSLNNDKAHYISNAGTGFAVLALRACETP
ncbi:MAG: prenyltransferase/squalene oxidase repeat-containing protein [Isosphaeraceae bacterium]